MTLKHKNKGFSLIELIVVISIMAIFTAILAPVLVTHIENTRRQQDESAAAEITNAVLIAMSDQDVYDEVLCYTAKGNISCYVDKQNVDELTDYIKTKDAMHGSKEQYMYGDNDRLKDEMVYYVAGNMRGMTITFIPEQVGTKHFFTISDGVINKYIQDESPYSEDWSDPASDRGIKTDTVVTWNGGQDYSLYGLIHNMKDPIEPQSYLYPRLRQILTDQIELFSNTYKYSEYTVFVRMGSNGGNSGDMQDSIIVYGQWNGTNLAFAEKPDYD